MLTEILVAAGEYGLEELTNMLYNHGYFPEELNKSICIALSRISGAANVKKKHRTIVPNELHHNVNSSVTERYKK